MVVSTRVVTSCCTVTVLPSSWVVCSEVEVICEELVTLFSVTRFGGCRRFTSGSFSAPASEEEEDDDEDEDEPEPWRF